MASGYGYGGGQGRCFPFWQELLACYVVNGNSDDANDRKKCVPALDDYYECLHHRKEYARVTALQRAYRKAASERPRENLPSADTIRNLGLIGKEEDTRAVLASFGSVDDGKKQ